MKNIFLLLSFFILATSMLYAQKKHEYSLSAYGSYDYIKSYTSLSGLSVGAKFGVRNKRNNYWQFGGFYSYLPSFYKCTECPYSGLQLVSSNTYEAKDRYHSFTVSADFTFEYLKREKVNLYFSFGRMFKPLRALREIEIAIYSYFPFPLFQRISAVLEPPLHEAHFTVCVPRLSGPAKSGSVILRVSPSPTNSMAA